MTQRTANEARARAQQKARQRRASGSGGGYVRGDGHTKQPTTATVQAPTIGLAERLRYGFDLTLSRGSGALILWLVVVTIVFVTITGVLLQWAAERAGLEQSKDAGFVENVWDSLMHTLDPGTVVGAEQWWYRAAALFITIVGIFIFSTLIGLIASVIDRTVENLRKGRGMVVEEGHTLILGWSDKLHTIISELKIANAHQHRSTIVVMANRDRVDMEDEINARFGSNLALELLTGRTALGFFRSLARRSGGTRLVCRTGNPADPADLALVSPLTASSIVVLSDDAEFPDAQAAKVLLALMSFDRDLTSMDVTMELVDDDTALALREAAGGRLQTVVSSDLVSRVMAQICRQAGMGAVFQELLDFDGDEIYFSSDPRLAGLTYGQALLSFETSSVLGLRRADGAIELNPDPSTLIGESDSVIAISDDDDTVVVGDIDSWTPTSANGERTHNGNGEALPPDHLLMVGWNENAPRVLRHVARAVSPGSTIDIVVDPSLAKVDDTLLPNGDGNLSARVVELDASRRGPLAQILDERDYERIVILGYRDAMDAPEADARTLLTLVHARRELRHGHRNERTSIVAELLDTRSVQLGKVANPDDFVVSARLTGLLIAQLAENPELAVVFNELLDGVGTEIVMRPLAPYLPESVRTGETIAFGELVRRARERCESALGYTVPVGTDGPNDPGVRVNPSKADPVPVRPDVHLVVLARSEPQ